MKGVITGREVAANLWLIFREFGPRCAFRCLYCVVRGGGTTFLDVALKNHGS